MARKMWREFKQQQGQERKRRICRARKQAMSRLVKPNERRGQKKKRESEIEWNLRINSTHFPGN